MFFSKLAAHCTMNDRLIALPINVWTKICDANPMRIGLTAFVLPGPGAGTVEYTMSPTVFAPGRGDPFALYQNLRYGPAMDFEITQAWYACPVVGSVAAQDIFCRETFLYDWPCKNRNVSESPYPPSDETEQPIALDTNPPTRPFDLPPIITTELENGPS